MSNVIDVRFRVTPVTAMVLDLTVTRQVADKPPSLARTVIVASPGATAETYPFDTVATFRLLEVHDTLGSVASEGLTVTRSEAFSPSVSSNEYELNVTAVTFVASTVTVQGELVTPAAVAVIVVDPTRKAVNMPFETVTTDGLLLDHEMPSYSAAAGSTVADNVLDPPTFNVTLLSLNRTLPTSGSHWQEDKKHKVTIIST